MGALKTYLDTSVLVAMFTPDATSARADRLLAQGAIVPAISDWARAEFAAAVARKVRTGDVTADGAQVAFSEFDVWLARIGPTANALPADIEASSTWLRRLDLGLRAPDALHISIALRTADALATFDQKMAEAAKQLGCRVVPA